MRIYEILRDYERFHVSFMVHIVLLVGDNIVHEISRDCERLYDIASKSRHIKLKQCLRGTNVNLELLLPTCTPQHNISSEGSSFCCVFLSDENAVHLFQ